MHKKIIATAALSAFLLTGAATPAMAAKSVSVTLPSFDVTLNGTIIENENRRYPLLVYNNITYVPMTYYDCRFLGLETTWNQQDGLGIIKSDLTGAYHEDTVAKKNSKRSTAQLVTGKVQVNGKVINNASEKYPLLLYRDVTYFPLTWRFAVDEFGWKYQFDNKNGLVITSNNIKTDSVTLKDGNTSAEGQTEFDFTINTDYLYYQGEKGAVYQRPLNDWDNDTKRKKAGQIPYEGTYQTDYWVASFSEEENQVYYSFYYGGASMGGGSKHRIRENQEPEVIYHQSKNNLVDFGDFSIQTYGPAIGGIPSIPMMYIAKDGTRSDLGLNGYQYAVSRDSYDAKRNVLYVLACKVDPDKGLVGSHNLYVVSLTDGSMKKLSNQPVENYKIVGDTIYYGWGAELYAQDLKTGKEQYITSGLTYGRFYAPIESGVYFGYAATGEDLCFWDKNTGKITVINGKSHVTSLYSQNGYVIALLKETPDNPYRLMVFDANGKQVYTSADVADKAVINQDGVLVYRLAGTTQLVKVQL